MKYSDPLPKQKYWSTFTSTPSEVKDICANLAVKACKQMFLNEKSQVQEAQVQQCITFYKVWKKEQKEGKRCEKKISKIFISSALVQLCDKCISPRV